MLKKSGKGGTGRYVVGEGDLDKARELILAAHSARAKAIQAKQAAEPKAAGRALEPTPSGRRARSRSKGAKVIA